LLFSIKGYNQAGKRSILEVFVARTEENTHRNHPPTLDKMEAKARSRFIFRFIKNAAILALVFLVSWQSKAADALRHSATVQSGVALVKEIRKYGEGNVGDFTPQPIRTEVVSPTKVVEAKPRTKYTVVPELTVIAPSLPTPLPRATVSYDSAVVRLDSPLSYWVVTKATETSFYLRDGLGTDIGPVPRREAKVIFPTQKNYPCAVAGFKRVSPPEGCPKPK
jgi:hypothetical protein